MHGEKLKKTNLLRWCISTIYIYIYILCCSVYCLCVTVYRATATGCQPNCSLQIHRRKMYTFEKPNEQPTYWHIEKNVNCLVYGVVWGWPLARIVGSNPARGMDVCLLWVLCSVRGLCVGLITCPEEPYRVSYVWVWSWSLDNEDPGPLRACVMRDLFTDALCSF